MAGRTSSRHRHQCFTSSHPVPHTPSTSHARETTNPPSWRPVFNIQVLTPSRLQRRAILSVATGQGLNLHGKPILITVTTAAPSTAVLANWATDKDKNLIPDQGENSAVQTNSCLGSLPDKSNIHEILNIVDYFRGYFIRGPS